MARLSTQWWWAVAAGWGLIAVGLFLAAPPFSDVAIYDFSHFLSHDADSVRGAQMLTTGWHDASFDRSLALVMPT